MQSDNLEEIKHTFEYLDKSRHLPSFRLEPHAAAFFALSLPQILSNYLGYKIHKTIIPEFPIRKGTIEPPAAPSKHNQSFKVDYVAFTQDGSTAFLVELKTDMTSKKKAKKQPWYLDRAKKTGFRGLFEGVKLLAEASTEKQKYAHLLYALSDSPCTLQDDSMKHMIDLAYDDCVNQTRWREAVKRIKFETEKCKCTEVLYIQPEQQNDDDFMYIDFETAAEFLENDGNDFEKLFACYLRKWVGKAGSVCPETRKVP